MRSASIYTLAGVLALAASTRAQESTLSPLYLPFADPQSLDASYLGSDGTSTTFEIVIPLTDATDIGGITAYTITQVQDASHAAVSYSFSIPTDYAATAGQDIPSNFPNVNLQSCAYSDSVQSCVNYGLKDGQTIIAQTDVTTATRSAFVSVNVPVATAAPSSTSGPAASRSNAGSGSNTASPTASGTRATQDSAANTAMRTSLAAVLGASALSAFFGALLL